MAIKRKTREEETQRKMEKKKKARSMDDRLNNLPHDLQLRILSSLDTKDAVKISLLSKTSGSLWTSIPFLEFNHSVFNNLHVFDKFVKWVLSRRDRSAKLDRLTFNRRGICSAKILENVFNHAFSNGVKQLEAYIGNSRNHTWPVSVRNSFESLTNLKLDSGVPITCPFIGPKSRSFKNLTVLHLTGAIITDLDPFSGFPMLEKLTLVDCDVKTEGETLNVHAPNLSDLNMLSFSSFKYCQLITPRLRFFEYQGWDFPQFKTHEGVPVLDTMVIGYNGEYYRMQEKRMFEDLVSMFCALPNAKCLTLNSSIVDILSLFQDQLVKRSSPFRKLKCLKLDFRYPGCKSWFDCPWPLESLGIPSIVSMTAYLLKNSPDAEVNIMSPKCKTKYK